MIFVLRGRPAILSNLKARCLTRPLLISQQRGRALHTHIQNNQFQIAKPDQHGAAGRKATIKPPRAPNHPVSLPCFWERRGRLLAVGRPSCPRHHACKAAWQNGLCWLRIGHKNASCNISADCKRAASFSNVPLPPTWPASAPLGEFYISCPIPGEHVWGPSEMKGFPDFPWERDCYCWLAARCSMAFLGERFDS